MNLFGTGRWLVAQSAWTNNGIGQAGTSFGCVQITHYRFPGTLGVHDFVTVNVLQQQEEREEWSTSHQKLREQAVAMSVPLTLTKKLVALKPAESGLVVVPDEINTSLGTLASRQALAVL